MKLNTKTLTLLLSAGIIFSLSRCGGGSSTLVDTDPAPGELGYQTILSDGSIEYVDYTGGTRVSPPSAADAEYHTGVDFNNNCLIVLIRSVKTVIMSSMISGKVLCMVNHEQILYSNLSSRISYVLI